MKETSRKITSKVEFGLNDGCYLPISKCICGSEFWPDALYITMEEDGLKECPSCKRKLFFKLSIDIYESI